MTTVQKYALITGHGRSGTNWLLDIFNASHQTFCRNEPNEVHDSPCNQLHPLWHVTASMSDMDVSWDELAACMASSMGERDHRLIAPKDYVHPLSQKLGIAYFPARPKILPALRVFLPPLRSGEWEMPWWIGDQSKLTQAYAVLKINQSARIAIWLLKNRPQVPVFHIVRHPGGRLNSWLNRFLAKRDVAYIRQRNRDRLREVLRISPEWCDIFGDIDAMSIAESEMWFWRYVTESIHRTGEGVDNYQLLLYENLAQDPMAIAQQIYQVCGLPWTKEIEGLIRQGTRRSMWGKVKDTPLSVAQAWRNKLKPEDVDAVNHVLRGSLMENWWSPL